MGNRDWNKSTLRVFLERIPPHELVENFIAVVDALCKDDDESFDRITKAIVTEVQVREILVGKSNLRNYSESRQKELFVELIKEASGEEIKDAVAAIPFKDWQESQLSFSDWWVQRNKP